MFHQVADIIVQYVVVPSSGMLRSLPPDQAKHGTATVFRNGTGILRNVSAASPETRKLLRVAPNLIEALLFFLRSSIQRNQVDNRAVENVVCLLRNLSYRLVFESLFSPSPYFLESKKLLIHVMTLALLLVPLVPSLRRRSVLKTKRSRMVCSRRTRRKSCRQ